MNVLSLFSGVGGMDLGLERAGHHVVGMCEIDPKARSVLRRRWPDTPIYDDVTTFDPGDFRGRVDLAAGGSPCQDLSVAGRRAGLDGERSGLFWHQCRVADQVASPWFLWENVAGALSSNGGADFAAVLWGITGALPDVPHGGWKSCGMVVGPKRAAVWRLLDARWFGVAQRRRRVFVVGGPRGLCGPEVLLEPESCERHPRPGEPTGEEVAGTLGGGAGSRGWAGDTDRMTFVPTYRRRAHGDYIADGLASSRTSTNAGDPTSDDLVPYVKARRAASVTDYETWRADETAPTLNTGDNTGDTRATVVVPFTFSWQNGGGYGNANPGLAYTEDGCGPLSASQVPAVSTDLAVRRLTPVECERLMSWPDDSTRHDDQGNEIADSHRYRFCGNGVVSNVAEWIGRRLP